VGGVDEHAGVAEGGEAVLAGGDVVGRSGEAPAATSSSATRARRSGRERVTGRSGVSGGAAAPEVIGAARDALGQEAAGALGVTRPEGGLEQGVVEDIALGAAAAQLDDP
jgi:hypothetical protein